MKHLRLLLFCTSVLGVSWPAFSTAAESQSLFNGKDISGWQGDPAVWTVTNGILTGHVPIGKEPRQYLIWTNEPVVGDFELSFSFRLVRGNAGVLYRAEQIGADGIRAYEYSQLDKTFRNGETGNIHETGSGKKDEPQFWGRNRLANLGSKIVIESTGKIVSDGNTAASPNEIRAKSATSDWQEGVIVAQGNHLVHRLNGFVVGEVTDLQNSRRRSSGLLLLRVVGSMNDTLVEFKDIRLKRL